MQEAKDELLKLLANEEAMLVPCLIFANKQDLPNAIKSEEVIEIMDIKALTSAKPVPYVRVQESSAMQDQGLFEGFNWLVDRIVEKSKLQAQSQ